MQGRRHIKSNCHQIITEQPLVWEFNKKVPSHKYELNSVNSIQELYYHQEMYACNQKSKNRERSSFLPICTLLYPIAVNPLQQSIYFLNSSFIWPLLSAIVF